MLVVNAANREKDASWISSRLTGGASFEDISDQTALLALQGRKAIDIIKSLSPPKIFRPKAIHLPQASFWGRRLFYPERDIPAKMALRFTAAMTSPKRCTIY